MASLLFLLPLAASASGVVNVGVESHRLSGGFGEWQGAWLRGTAWQKPETVFNYELVAAERFGDRGQYAALGVTRTFDPRWYGSLTVGGGSSDFIFPQWSTDATLNRKWLDDASLVTTVGLGAGRATDGHRDVRALLGVTWYAPGDWIVEAGWRPNRSNPGAVRSNSGFVALTWGREGEQYWIMRHDNGREAYQLIGDQQSLVDFPSRSTSLAWRRWLGPRCGTQLQLEHYHNPNYDRRGVQVGVFCGY